MAATSTDDDATPPARDSAALSVRNRVLRWLVEEAFDEFSPWLKWKVYDILWAISLLLLGRRLKCVRKAQEILDL